MNLTLRNSYCNSTHFRDDEEVDVEIRYFVHGQSHLQHENLIWLHLNVQSSNTLKNYYFLMLNILVYCLGVSLRMCSWNPRRPEEGDEYLETGGTTVVSRPVGAGNHSQCSERAASALKGPSLQSSHISLPLGFLIGYRLLYCWISRSETYFS